MAGVGGQRGQCQGSQKSSVGSARALRKAVWAMPGLSGGQHGQCWASQEGSMSNARVLASALSCLNSQQAELLRGCCHGQLHLMCGSYLAHGGCSFPLIFGGIDL